MVDKDIKNVIHNASYLLITQGVAYIAPILILGHLIKTFGVEGFGKYALCLSVAAYLQVIVDYGFSFSASRKISQQREDKRYISRVYWATSLIKICISCLLLPFYILAINIATTDNVMIYALSTTFLLTLGNTIFPIWFYQGIEKLKIIAILNFTSRITSCVLVVLFVNEKSDVGLAILLQAMPVIIAGVIANLNVIYQKYIIFEFPVWADVKSNFMEGWDIFVATLASTILTNSAVFVLGIYTTPSVVGFYAAVERIIRSVVSLFAPITQSLYPYNCKNFGVSFSVGLASVNKTGRPLALVALFVSLIILSGWDYVVDFLNLPDGTFYIACVLSAWLFFGVVNNIFGIQILSASGHAKLYSRAFMLSALLTLALLLLIVPSLASIGAAIAVAVGEFILFILLLWKVRKLEVKLSR